MGTSADLKLLKRMHRKAKRLEKKVDSCDHWAKPYYSNVHIFKPKVERVFIGVNPGGNRHSKDIHKKYGYEKKIRSNRRLSFNSYLDERWGDKPNGAQGKGEALLQVAVKDVFKAMYGKGWRKKLRGTPCFNIVPISSRGKSDKQLDDKIWKQGVKWGIELVKYLEPDFIILYGNGEDKYQRKGPWAALESEFGLQESPKEVLDCQLRKSLKRGTLTQSPLKGVEVIGLPHLTNGMNEKVRQKMYGRLSDLAAKCPFS